MDKPAEMTSHDVVAMVRRVAGERKVGHTGTLDPLATGVLVLCLGPATKALPYLPEGTKTYQVEARLGISTATQDRTGRVVAESWSFAVTRHDLCAALEGFLGSGTQLTPMYSAVQVHGERLYRLARAGREVARPERRIEVVDIHLDWPSPEECPVLRHGDRFGFTVTGSRGLYVRTLCHDLGQTLGCGAHLTELRRLASGPFRLADALPVQGLTKAAIAENLLAIGTALGHLPAVFLDELASRRVAHGNSVAISGPVGGDLARAVGPTGRTIAVLGRRGDSWQPRRVFQEPT